MRKRAQKLLNVVDVMVMDLLLGYEEIERSLILHVLSVRALK